jgi:carboxylesterase type B
MLWSLVVPLAFFIANVLADGIGPIISTGSTKYWGNDSLPGIHFFGGIRYAQPPLANLRFRRPQPLLGSTGTEIAVDSRNWGPICLQQPATVGFGSEVKFAFVLDV